MNRPGPAPGAEAGAGGGPSRTPGQARTRERGWERQCAATPWRLTVEGFQGYDRVKFEDGTVFIVKTAKAL